MRTIWFTFVLGLSLLVNLVGDTSDDTTNPNNDDANKKIEDEVRNFLSSYASDLRQHKRTTIADRYDRRGAYFVGQGRKVLVSHSQIKSNYEKKWQGPAMFTWKDLSVEVLSTRAAVVVGLFDWENEKGEIETVSYTGLLVKDSGQWRIRLEDESSQPAKSEEK